MVWSLLLTAGSEGPTLISCTTSHLLSSVRSWHTVVCLSHNQAARSGPRKEAGVARSSGFGQTANGVGKILGPLSIAVIAGTSNIVSPQATEGALTGGFLFLAAGMALVGLSFLLLGVETHGRAMTVEAEPEPIGAAAANRVERVF